jgi:hypothetical protein
MKSYNIKGTFFIKANKTLEETVKTINTVTNLNLSKDDSGYYEEFPAYSNHSLGIQFALLGPPELKYRVQNVDYNKYDFMISDYFKFKNDETIDLSPTIMKLLNSESDLECYK